jgi:GST-like protein
MIDLYTWPTPNGIKLHILVEELGIPYTIHPVNIRKGEQFAPEFLKFSPNNKIPALIDQDGPGGKPYAVFESGAMMMYLTEKTGKLMPTDMAGRYVVVQWLMFQMASIGPMFGQLGHFTYYAPEKNDYAIDRYWKEGLRLYNVMDRRLGEANWLGGDDYSIADIAVWPWVRGYENRGYDLKDQPNVLKWIDTIAERPATKRGLEILK